MSKRAAPAADVPEAATIRELTNTDAGFYPLLGPFLARRAIVQEFGGYPLWDEDGKRWFVALDRTGRQVMGFASLMVRERGAERGLWLDDAYVLPQWRERGLYRQLLEARLATCPADAEVRVVSLNPRVVAMLERRGFTIDRYRGRWAWMRRAAQSRKAEQVQRETPTA